MNKKSKKRKVKKRAKEIRRISPPELEAEVREFLGSAGIHTTKEIAEGLKRDRGAVHRACERLYDDGILRLSRIPKVLYRFALTGEVLHGDNFPVITLLIARVRTASSRSGSLRGKLPKIFAKLRSVRELKTPSRLGCINRCERAAKAIKSDEQLLEQMSLHPFRIEVIRWWPQALEDEYIEPMQGVADKLDKARIRRLADRFPQLYRTGSAQAGRKTSVEKEDAKKVILQTQKAYDELLDELVAAGVEELLAERDAQLSRLVAKETILHDDLKVTTETELEKGLEVARSSRLGEERLGRSLLIHIDADSLRKHLDSLGSDGGTRKDRWGWKRWLASSMQVAWGGGLVAFDLSLALGKVLAGVDISVAGVNVGVALALFGSVHTGGKNVLDTFKEMAEELEKAARR